MKKLALMLLTLACGAPPEETEVKQSWLETAGPTKPWLSINGDVASTDPAWTPTGVAFDSREQGWRISCLPGPDGRVRVLQFGLGDSGGGLRLFCVPADRGL